MATLRMNPLVHFGRFGFLLVSLTALFTLAPFFNDAANGVSVVNFLFSAVMVTGVYAVSQERKWLWLGMALVLPSLVLEWLARLNPLPVFIISNLIVTALFIGFVATVVMLEILRDDEVSTDTILGGICIYLLIGFIWVLAYAFIEYWQPGSILAGGQTLQSFHPELQIRFPELMYFSFVTMTTLGYGDILPATPLARSMAASEAVVGQLYVAIFVARLVGLHLASRQNLPPSGDR